MTEPTEDKKTRKTQYEMGREDAEKELSLLLSISIDSYPNMPSAATLQRIGADAGHIFAELKRFAGAIRRGSKATATEVA